MADFGRMQQRVTIQQHSSTVNADGQKVRSWSTYATRWAKITAAGGRETFRDDQLKADITHQIELHSDTLTRAITPQMRILWGNRTLNIVRSYDPTGWSDRVVIEAKEDV